VFYFYPEVVATSLLQNFGMDLSVDLIFPTALGPGVYSASNRNEYQESSWGIKGGQPAPKADNLTAIFETIFCEMWEPRRLTTL
jgi:hypothetical protein